jgi:lipid-A-disaccharide synthase
MKYYIIAGEASGDLHASNLIRELKKLDPDARFRCWGGDKIQEQGAILVHHYRDTAYMGFVEVVAHIRKILGYIHFCKSDIVEYRPDALILIDYPGFNLRIAEFAHKKGFRVFYYISPQVWAWKQSRVKKIRANVDRMFVILPFEKDFYAARDVQVEYVGHPLLDALSEFNAQKPNRDFAGCNGLLERPVIALLPGSRQQEIARILPVMLQVAGNFPDYQFVVAGLFALPEGFYNRILGDSPIRIIYDQTYGLLQNSTAALVTSGTATLEAALWNVPQVICYKGGTLSYQIARLLVKVPFIGLVNLIMGKEIVKELIQKDLMATNIKRELLRILPGGADRQRIITDYASLKEKLGGMGASKRTARRILALLS